MSENTKLPKGAAQWWNLPMREMTPEQQSIKRKYARDLYHKKKATKKVGCTDLQRENELLKSILENYRIDLKSLFDNIMISGRENLPKTATFSRYKHYVTRPSFKISGNVQTAFMAFAANDTLDMVTVSQDVETCSCKALHVTNSVLENEQWTVSVRIPRYFDAIKAVTTPGDITKVQIVHNIPVDGVQAVEYGDIKGQTCIFPIPIPCPMHVEMHLEVTFKNQLNLDRLPSNPIALMQLEALVLHSKVRNDILGMNVSGSTPVSNSWPKDTPVDTYFCRTLNIT